MTDIVSAAPEDIARHFPNEPFRIAHRLADHPLFTLRALTDLARALPRDRIEYNAGDIAPGVKAEDIPMLDLPAVEVIRRIESCNAWMVLKRVEAMPAYRRVLEEALDGVARQIGHRDAKAAGLRDIQGFVFISSANATTPFHFDPEENLFVQIRGPKFFHIFDNRDNSILSAENLEISPATHRNMPYRDEFESRGQLFRLHPGEGVFVPHLWPHWVRTGGEHSISMAITWKSPRAERLNTLLSANGLLRRAGLPQARPGARPLFDAAKIAAYAMSRLAIEPLRRSEAARRWLRAIIFGRKANYYYGEKNV